MLPAKHYLTPDAVQHALCLADLSEFVYPGHAVALLAEALIGGLPARDWPLAVVHRTHRVVSPEHNHGRLGLGLHDHSERAEQTLWVNDLLVLRSHTRGGACSALQAVARARLPGEVLAVAVPGLTFRQGPRDRWHSTAGHHMDLWLLGEPSLSNRRALLKLVGDVLCLALPGRAWAHQDCPQAFTEGGLAASVMSRECAVPVLEAGCLARNLLQRLDIDPALHGGLAVGVNLDRLVMLRKGIPDIRLLREQALDVSEQLHDLQPWKPINRPAAIVRELSVALVPGQSLGALTAKVLAAAGNQADCIEQVAVRGRWPLSELPSPVAEELGMYPGQENVVLRITLRRCVGHLQPGQAELLFTAIEQALHEGTLGGGYRIGRRN